MDNELTVWDTIQNICKKPLPMYSFLSQTESVNRKVPGGIIYSRNSLLHLDPALAQLLKVHWHNSKTFVEQQSNRRVQIFGQVWTEVKLSKHLI